jgi:hypothetical protein
MWVSNRGLMRSLGRLARSYMAGRSGERIALTSFIGMALIHSSMRSVGEHHSVERRSAPLVEPIRNFNRQGINGVRA